MVDRAELAAITAWCAANGVRLVSDEIYHGVTYPEPGAADPRGVCAWESDDSAVVLTLVRKYWGMTGWRLGWMLLPADLVRAVDALAGNVALCPPAPAQYAAVSAFAEESYARATTPFAEFARTRDAAARAACERLGWGESAPPDGAFYYWADLGPGSSAGGRRAAYASALLEEAGVAITPGGDFDDRSGGRSVRLSFAAGRRRSPRPSTGSPPSTPAEGTEGEPAPRGHASGSRRHTSTRPGRPAGAQVMSSTAAVTAPASASVASSRLVTAPAVSSRTGHARWHRADRSLR